MDERKKWTFFSSLIFTKFYFIEPSIEIKNPSGIYEVHYQLWFVNQGIGLTSQEGYVCGSCTFVNKLFYFKSYHYVTSWIVNKLLYFISNHNETSCIIIKHIIYYLHSYGQTLRNYIYSWTIFVRNYNPYQRWASVSSVDIKTKPRLIKIICLVRVECLCTLKNPYNIS